MIKQFFYNHCFYLFSYVKRYRSWYGGVWERWIVDAAGGPHGDWWFYLDKTTQERDGRRPHPICKGTPTVEDYRNKV